MAAELLKGKQGDLLLVGAKKRLIDDYDYGEYKKLKSHYYLIAPYALSCFERHFLIETGKQLLKMVIHRLMY